MSDASKAKDVVRITLDSTKDAEIESPESTIVESLQADTEGAAGGMSMRQLKKSYDAILRAGAIFYPVVFHFQREIGRGRQGVVFLGLRQGARGCITEHAIKVFDPGLYKDSREYWTDMGRIASQISRLQGIQSPNLVARHSYEETYGIGYVQMEAVDGMDLRMFLSRENVELGKSRCTAKEWARFSETIFHLDGDRIALQPGVVVYVLRRVLQGIERLHETSFLHCDIKPGNIMIDRLGSIKLVDFGRAVMVGEELTFLLGSPLYMAPETHRRKPSGLQTDFYSVGLVGLEMLRGEALTDGSSIKEEELLEIKLGLSDRLADVLPEHVKKRRSLTKIIRRLLEPDIKNRYGTAKEADVGDDGLVVVDKQLTKVGDSIDYRRELADYISRLVDNRTNRVEA